MKNYTLYFATNRHHKGDDTSPSGYGPEFSDNGRENLRFGMLRISADEQVVQKYLTTKIKNMGEGDGVALSGYFTTLASEAKIDLYAENINKSIPDHEHKATAFGSTKFFNDVKSEMMAATDVVVFIHGFNVSWNEAVGSALALESMLNKKRNVENHQEVKVILFSWPSDGSMFPYRAYKSDRVDARDSGYAVGRGILKLRDFLISLRSQAITNKNEKELCKQDIHLLCHSMGNYVLQSALERIQEFTTGKILPRIVEHVCMCSPDIDDDVFEKGQPMERLTELAQSISIYFNNNDKALLISDITKNNVERLGTNGAAHPYLLHKKIHQINCTNVVPGFTEHSYYLWGSVNEDIKQSIAKIPQDSLKRKYRTSTKELPNLWRMKRL